MHTLLIAIVYLQDVLQQYIVMRLPSIMAISREPETGEKSQLVKRLERLACTTLACVLPASQNILSSKAFFGFGEK